MKMVGRWGTSARSRIGAQELAAGNRLDIRWLTAVLAKYDTELQAPRPHWAPGSPLLSPGG